MELLTTVVYQSVTNRPRAWSSHTHLPNRKDAVVYGPSMNSVQDPATYTLPTYKTSSHTFKTAATTYDFPEHAPSVKKERKWSISNLFRRKKKDDSGSSSDEGMRKKNRKKEKRKRAGGKSSLIGGGVFDHIVPQPGIHLKKGSLYRHTSFDDAAVFSEPSGYFGRAPPPAPAQLEQHRSQNSLDSGDSISKRSRKERTKARAVARRDSMNQASSSEDGENDSQRSCSSSRFRSDDSLAQHPHQRDASASRRSRAARTDRYIRRLSKDDESILNREAMQRQARENWQMKIPQDDMQMPPAGNHFSGLFTIPPSHSNIKYRNSNSHMPLTEEEVHTAVHPPQNSHSSCFSIRSLSCDSNIHKSPSPEEIRTNAIREQRYRNLSLVEQPYLGNMPMARQPPPPPPRDPRRLMQHVNGHPLDTRCLPHWFPPPNPMLNHQQKQVKSSYRRSQFSGYRTASEDVIPTCVDHSFVDVRPASVTNESRKHCFAQHVSPAERKDGNEQFKYLTEKRPRSRKPIFIQSYPDRINIKNYRYPNGADVRSSVQPSRNYQNDKTRKSPQIFTAKTRVQTKIFLPTTIPNTDKQPRSLDVIDGLAIPRQNSPFKPICSPTSSEDRNMSRNSKCEEPNEEMKRKSANLEEALDELEAIYKSLHLGDEDLLERAEQRELSIAAKKMSDSHNETYTGIPRGAMSDSSFSYESLKTMENTPNKKMLTKAHTLDRKADDMAFRKMSRDSSRPNTLTSGANISYLLASPVHFDSSSPQTDNTVDEVDAEGPDEPEPDVMLDDVVYRIVKQANNSLKVPDPQPPFGIPIGPVTPGVNSDYLHAVPETISDYESLVCAKHKIPDIVKDDLAYRNLRKDANKEPALKPVSPVQAAKEKKKRAVRSLSANISNLIKREEDCDNEFKKANLTDIADAMEIARQILKAKDNRIQATKRAFLSDSETKHRRDVTEATTERRLNFLNEMRSFEKVDSASPKESAKDSRNSSFEELLTALAVEARETSERITNDLHALDDTLKRTDMQRKLLREIDEASEHAKHCEKMLECVVENTEEVEHIEHLIPESVANIITTRIEDEVLLLPTEILHSASDPEQPDHHDHPTPFEEQRDALVASFQEINDEVIGGVV